MTHSRHAPALSRWRLQVRAVQAGRAALEAALMGSEALVEGSVVEVRTVCGKAGCRCRRGKRHRHGPYLHLSLFRKGKTRMIHLPREWCDEVKAGVAAARAFWRARREWRALGKRMDKLWQLVEKSRRYLPYEPKKKSR